MPEAISILLAFGIAALAAVILCRLVIFLRIMDAPTEARKTQKAPTPSAGGLGMALAAAIAIVSIAVLTGWPLDTTNIVISAGGLACLALGLADDTLHVPALAKLLLLLAITLGMTLAGARADVLEAWPDAVLNLPMALAVAGSIVWLIVLINAVNFMDGANGLSMGMAAIAAAGLAAVSALIGVWDIALLAAALSGAIGGFLVWNVPGKLFVGDTGALFVGAVLGGLCLELVRLRPDLLFVPPILAMPFLSDVLLTLAWRAKHGKKLFEAHRDHAYQIAIKGGLKHWQVATIHAVWALNAAAIAIIAGVVGGQVPLLAFLVLLLVSTWLHIWVRRVGVKAGLVGVDIP
ncbi:MAG: glycosyl transferase [Hyphomonadaceae bacterium]|nr:glycosyl transferase [Hyphomonadaceae bacterium]